MLYCYKDHFDLHQLLVLLFDHINIRNCARLHIFAQFDPLNKNLFILFYFLEYELHIFMSYYMSHKSLIYQI